jgi:hypothetical protein
MVVKFVKHVKSQWYLYLIILCLLTLSAFKPDKAARQASGVGANAEQAATQSLAGEGKTRGDSASAQVFEQVWKGEVPKEISPPAVVVDAPAQCIGGCPGSCAGPKTRTPFRATQWRYAPDVGLYYLPLQSGWLVSASAPGNGANVDYVPRSPWPKLLRGLRRGNGCGAGFDKGSFLNRTLRGGGVCDSRAPRVAPQPPIPSVESLLGIGRNSDGGAVSGNGVENQPEKDPHERHVPELLKPSGVPSGGQSGGETGSDSGDALSFPGGAWAGGEGDDADYLDEGDNGSDGDSALPDNIAALPGAEFSGGKRASPRLEAGAADTAGVCR